MNTQPNPTRCRLCDDSPTRRCAFHAVQTSAQLAGVVEAAFRQFGAVGLSQFIEAALAQLETMLPARARVAALELDPAPLTRQFEDALELDEFTPSDLRRLAAVALSLAILNEE